MHTKYYIDFGQGLKTIWIPAFIDVFRYLQDGTPLNGHDDRGNNLMANIILAHTIEKSTTVDSRRTLNIIFNQRPDSVGVKFFASGHADQEFEVEYFLDKHDVQFTMIDPQDMPAGLVVKAKNVDQLFKIGQTYRVIV